MSLNLSSTFIEPLFLVEMVWPDATYRYLYGAGFVNWNGYNWLSIDDTQGQILNIGTMPEGGEEVPNLDISLGFTATLGGYIKLGKSASLTINIWRAERNPQSGALQVDTQSTWKCNEFEMVWGETIDLVLMADIGRQLSKSDALKTSSEHRKRLVTTTDYAFDKISGVKSGVNSYSGTSGSSNNGGLTWQNNTLTGENILT